MTGRKPQPRARQIAQGDPRRQGPKKLAAALLAEPQAAAGLPPAPAHLGERARLAWDFWAAELQGMQLDRRPDAQMLEGACVAYETAVACYELVAKQGRLIAKKKLVTKKVVDPATHELVVTEELVVVDVKPHPAVTMGKHAWNQVRAFCSEFGFSPASRTRLDAAPPKEEVDLMALLSAPREPKKKDVVQ